MFTSSEDVHVCHYQRCLNTPTHADALHRTRTVMFREVSHRRSFDEPNLRTVDRVALCSARRLPRTMIPSIKRTNKSDFSRSPFRVYLLVSNCKEESRALLGPVQVFSFLEQRDDEFVSLSFRNGPSIAQRTDEMSFAAHSIHRHLTVLRKEEATKDRQTHTKRERERSALTILTIVIFIFTSFNMNSKEQRSMFDVPISSFFRFFRSLSLSFSLSLRASHRNQICENEMKTIYWHYYYCSPYVCVPAYCTFKTKK